MDVNSDDIETRIEARRQFMRHFDEVCERLLMGGVVNPETFMPDSERAKRKTSAINMTLTNKSKL
jgi:hypothetical protein